MNAPHRSGCPINLTVEILGDKWSLIILRDIMFGGKRHFRELLNGSQEGIASNILAERLKKLVAQAMLTKADDPSHKQKAIYSLTEAAIQLLPTFALIGAWGSKWLPVNEELSIRAILLDEGGQDMWQQFMQELRWEHLGDPAGAPRAVRTPVRERLQAAYLDVMERKYGSAPAPAA
jgi:DNA-binding HxlR family transcriptional regulator